MTYEDAKKEIAIKHKLGMTLVTGHKASYFEEAALLYARQFKVKNFVQPDVSGQLPDCNLRGKMHIIDLNVNKCIECGKGYSGNLR